MQERTNSIFWKLRLQKCQKELNSSRGLFFVVTFFINAQIDLKIVLQVVIMFLLNDSKVLIAMYCGPVVVTYVKC